MSKPKKEVPVKDDVDAIGEVEMNEIMGQKIFDGPKVEDEDLPQEAAKIIFQKPLTEKESFELVGKLGKEVEEEEKAKLDTKELKRKPEDVNNEHEVDFTVTQIAKVCHEVNRVYCESIGDRSQKPWAEAPRWQQISAINGVKYKQQNPEATPEDMHISWMKQKQEEGWKYGEFKNESKKTHPCMVDYKSLPIAQQTKDHLFSAVVKSF